MKHVAFCGDGLVKQECIFGVDLADGLVRQEHVYADGLLRQEFVVADGLLRQEFHCVGYRCVGVYGSRSSLVTLCSSFWE